MILLPLLLYFIHYLSFFFFLAGRGEREGVVITIKKIIQPAHSFVHNFILVVDVVYLVVVSYEPALL